MRSKQRATRALVIGWTALVVTCGGVVALKVWQNHASKALEVRKRDAIETARRHAMLAPSTVPTTFEAAHRAWKSGTGPAPTTQVVAALINGGNPIALESTPGTRHWWWTDPQTRVEWVLEFEDDVWIGFTKLGWSAPQAAYAPPPKPWLYDEVEQAVTAILLHGWMGGLVAAALTAVTLPWRRAAPLAHVLLAVALVYLLIDSVPMQRRGRGPGPSLVERLPGVLLMSGGALVAMWFHYRPRRRRPDDPVTCDACGYDLTGNVSGVCPECGAPVAAATSNPFRPSASRTGSPSSPVPPPSPPS